MNLGCNLSIARWDCRCNFQKSWSSGYKQETGFLLWRSGSFQVLKRTSLRAFKALNSAFSSPELAELEPPMDPIILCFHQNVLEINNYLAAQNLSSTGTYLPERKAVIGVTVLPSRARCTRTLIRPESLGRRGLDPAGASACAGVGRGAATQMLSGGARGESSGETCRTTSGGSGRILSSLGETLGREQETGMKRISRCPRGASPAERCGGLCFFHRNGLF